MSVGSPPCHAMVTSGPSWDSITCRMYVASTSSGIRNRSPGYSASFSRKKQYEQSRLQIGPDGFARTWKPGGAVGGRSTGIAGPPPGGRNTTGTSTTMRMLGAKIEGVSLVALRGQTEE